MFQKLLDKGKSVLIHNQNLQTLPTEIFKVTKVLTPDIFSNVSTQETNKITLCVMLYTSMCLY